MKVIIINQFLEKHQDRISLVRLLVEFQPGLGLKGAKEKLDSMLEGEPMKLEIVEKNIHEFQESLQRLNLDFKVE